MNFLKLQMKKIYCIKAISITKIKNPKILYFFTEMLVLSTVCEKCGSNENTIFKEE